LNTSHSIQNLLTGALLPDDEPELLLELLLLEELLELL
jgi:hypothetical protein